MSAGAPRKPTGVSLEPAILAYLDGLLKGRRYKRFSRSDLINQIIEEHAEGKGTPLFSTNEEEHREVVNA